MPNWSRSTSFPPLVWDLYARLPSPIRKQALCMRHANIWDRIADECPYLFLHIPKTGGTALVSKLYQGDSNHFPWWAWSTVNPERFRNAFKFTVIREPAERFVSVVRHCLGAPKASGLERRAGSILKEHGRSVIEMCDAYLTNSSLRRRLRRIVHFKSQSFWIAGRHGPVVNQLFALAPNLNEFAGDENCNTNHVAEMVKEIPDSIRSKVYDLYEEDVQLYESVTQADLIDDVFEVLPRLELAVECCHC